MLNPNTKVHISPSAQPPPEVLRLPFTDHLSGPGRAIGPVCVCVCVTGQYLLNEVNFAVSS